MKLILAIAVILISCEFPTNNANGLQFMGADKFLNKYSRFRFTFDCLGYANMKQETLQLVDAIGQCLAENMTETTPNLDKEDKNLRNMFRPMYSEGVVRMVKSQVLNRIKIVECWQRKIKAIDDDGNIIFDHWIRKIKSFKLDSKLEADIIDGFKYCRDLSNFSSAMKMPSALPPALKKALTFLHCQEEMTAMACFKKEMRMTEAEYDLAGLDGFMSDLSDTDKITAVVWSNIMLNTIIKDEEVIF